jgi:hypothetical protein
MSVVDYLTLALWIVAAILGGILFFVFGWGLGDLWDAIHFSPSKEVHRGYGDALRDWNAPTLRAFEASLSFEDNAPAPIVGAPPTRFLIEKSRRIRDMERLLDHPRSDWNVRSPEIHGVGYTGGRGVIFQAATIHRFPPGFNIRGGYIYESTNPFEQPRANVVGGVSFHPRPGVILPPR